MFSKLHLKIKRFFSSFMKESHYLSVLMKLRDVIVLPSPECFLSDLECSQQLWLGRNWFWWERCAPGTWLGGCAWALLPGNEATHFTWCSKQGFFPFLR